MTFQPAGDHPEAKMQNLHLLHGTLPREPVCTENLTPFLKLLPCKGKAGISSLLDGHKLFDASWQSMSIDVRPVCSNVHDECNLEIDQTVDMVLDIERSKRHRDNPIPRPVPTEELICDTTKSYASDSTCYPLDHTSEPSWSLGEVFGRKIRGACPLTESEGPASESVCVNVPSEREVQASAGAEERQYDEGRRRCYKLPDSTEFDLVLPQQPLTPTLPSTTPLLYAERSFTGHGQERGGVQTILTNPSTTSSVSFVYLESLPWFLKPYLHTLSASLSSSPSSSINTSTTSADDSSLIKDIYYRPALDRHRPTHLEILLTVPASSTAILTYAFEKAILRYTEYPPDANRGFDVPPAIIRVFPPPSSEEDQGPVYLRTTSLLLPLPTPDFSMPYNVIILTSTVMALAFGGVFNLLVRRFVGADEVERWNLQALKGKMAGRIARLKERLGWGREKGE
ncbi:MAG: Subunit of the glycosylphosphatidylinositol transamidase complex-like protein [Piccolia ochrophora]|nr:MAG: Subunit of the glycosylphosphatidylinositol transamidase complex-like protein [Piccolia ochrophora]